MTGLPTILLIQGSFQLPEVYSKLNSALVAEGYPVVQPALPSLTDHDDPDFPSRSLTDDVVAVQVELKRLVEQEGRDVLVAMHSYGGLVGSDAVLEELTASHRKEKGLPGGVIRLFFFAAFILKEGESVLEAFGEGPNNEVKPDGRFTMRNTQDLLYHDLPREEAEHWASKTIDQSYEVQKTRLSRAAYRYVPSTYVVCENDQGLPPAIQRQFGKQAGAKVLGIQSGHSPMLSKTSELVKLISQAAEEDARGPVSS
ncbi:alpha/beta-hydrolase [Xylariomycetidae sp. FL0641]|nr:alpha/beta-hydrolase [Xylariomycetidae sp. FL0641]